MTVITLLTDYGLQDGYPSVMKGVIWNIAPQAQIADITNSIRPQDIFQGTQALSRTAHFFPPGTIHVAVVDPGVGTSRRPLGLRLGEHYFVGPDNGLFTLVIERAENQSDPIELFHLDKPGYWLPEVSPVFHGRDIFAPVAAHLANGVSLDKLGTRINDPVRYEIPKPQITQKGWLGQVIHVDQFGNLSTNLTRTHLDRAEFVTIAIKGVQIEGLVTTFGERPPGSLVALIDSSGYLAISVVNSSAAQLIHADVGDTVELLFHS